GDVRLIVEHRVGAAGLHGEVGLVELFVRLGFGTFDVVLDVGRARRAQTGRDRLAVEVLDALDVVIVGRHAHDEAGLVVRVGEVDGFLALVGDADAGDGEVEGSGLEAGDDSVEVRYLLLELESGIVGDGGDEIDVEAGVFAVLLELEGDEGRVGGVGVAVLELSLGVPFAARAARQARGHRNGGCNGDSGHHSSSVLHLRPHK